MASLLHAARVRVVLPLLLMVVAACDSGPGITLDAAYYVGAWTLVHVADEAGANDRTAEVLALVDDFTATFRSDGTFTLAIDFIPDVNAAGQDDVNVSGTYQATETLVVLQPEGLGLAPSLVATAQSDARVDLRGSNLIISQLLGANLEITFSGPVVLGIQRR